MRYSIETRDQIFVDQILSKNIAKNINMNFRGKCCEKLLDYTKQFATDALKITSKWEVQIAAEATDELIFNTIAVKITETSPWSSLEAASMMKNK